MVKIQSTFVSKGGDSSVPVLRSGVVPGDLTVELLRVCLHGYGGLGAVKHKMMNGAQAKAAGIGAWRGAFHRSGTNYVRLLADDDWCDGLAWSGSARGVRDDWVGQALDEIRHAPEPGRGRSAGKAARMFEEIVDIVVGGVRVPEGPDYEHAWRWVQGADGPRQLGAAWAIARAEEVNALREQLEDGRGGVAKPYYRRLNKLVFAMESEAAEWVSPDRFPKRLAKASESITSAAGEG